jgi:hypothetical protein
VVIYLHFKHTDYFIDHAEGGAPIRDNLPVKGIKNVFRKLFAEGRISESRRGHLSKYVCREGGLTLFLFRAAISLYFSVKLAQILYHTT